MSACYSRNIAGVSQVSWQGFGHPLQTRHLAVGLHVWIPSYEVCAGNRLDPLPIVVSGHRLGYDV